MERVPLPPDEDAADAVDDAFDALSVALSKEDPLAVVFGASDGFPADVDVVWLEDDAVEPEVGLVVAADELPPVGVPLAEVEPGVVAPEEDALGVDGFDEVVVDPEEDVEDAVSAGLSAGLAATFSGFRSIVTGRLEPELPEADCDVEPVVPDLGASPEPAAPEEEDLPLAGSLSDAISTPPAPFQGYLIPLYTPARQKIPLRETLFRSAVVRTPPDWVNSCLRQASVMHPHLGAPRFRHKYSPPRVRRPAAKWRRS